MSPAGPLLSLEGLTITFRTRSGIVNALEGVSFEVAPGEMIGLVGESGSGKSVTAFSIMGLLDASARIVAGRAMFQGQDLLSLREAQLDELRGRDLSIVFQNPRTALNPIRPVGQQIADVIARHAGGTPAEVARETLAALKDVRIPDAERRLGAYPYELSGGMCQRVGIAMALACRPKLLIADEPTTGLDVTTQAVVMDLFREVVAERHASAILITHDLALASEYCQRIVVMHAGHVVETAPVEHLFAAPRHPYTAKLLASLPSGVANIDELQSIAGSLPDLRRTDLPPCRFSERCDRRMPVCDEPALRLSECGPAHYVACRVPL